MNFGVFRVIIRNMRRLSRIIVLGVPLHIINLGHDNEERQFAYRELFRHELEPEKIDKIRKATNGNFALGSNRFIEEVSKMLGRRVTPGKAVVNKQNKCGLSQ